MKMKDHLFLNMRGFVCLFVFPVHKQCSAAALAAAAAKGNQNIQTNMH